MDFKIIKGGISAPKGFFSNGIACGLKKVKEDLALIVSNSPCEFAGTFTTNIVAAAPVIWDRKIVKEQNKAQAIVINSANANACTGKQGLLDTEKMAEITAIALNKNFPEINKENVLVCSTGVIGVPLQMDKIKVGIENCSTVLKADETSALNTAKAIMTTDKTIKEIAISTLIDGKEVKIGAIAKGSGMIHPNMATMLSFITTDAKIKKETLQKLLGNSVEDSYNMICVDGDTSTNDTVLVLANGESSDTFLEDNEENLAKFKEAFEFVNTYLAKEIIKDGEGAGTFISVNIKNASSIKAAKTLAKSIVKSSLVKAAFFGSDANFGRILCAMGYSGAFFDLEKLDLSFKSSKGTIDVVKQGLPIAFDEKKAKEILLEKEVVVDVTLQDGNSDATAWGCDLSYEYVRINGDYRS